MTYLPPDKAASFQPPTKPDPKPIIKDQPKSGDTFTSIGRDLIDSAQESETLGKRFENWAPRAASKISSKCSNS